MEYRIRAAAFTALESLETRRLLASISGTVIEDLDNDGSRDGRERGIAGTTVFLDQNKNRQFDFGEQSTTTDGAGFYEFTGLPAGQYFVAHLPPSSYGQNSPGKNGFGNSGGDFDITLQFADSVPTEGRSVIESAAARWEKIIVGDLPGVFDDKYGDIDDTLLEVFGKKIDGEGGRLAQAKPDFYRDADDPKAPNLPYRGSLEFDLADADNPALFEIAVHEIGHALGFTVFTWLEFTDPETGDPLLIDGTTSSPIFLGENATREYRTIFNKPNAPGVPLEDYGAGTGSSFSHFSETIFGNELMTPFLGDAGSPVSRVTVGLLQDIGYKVDYRGADPYDPDVQDLPITEPDTAGGGLVDWSYTITIDNADTVVQGRDFSDRLNRRPSLDALRSDNAFYGINEIVKLRAVGASDNDAGDSVTAVSFYAETNSIEGLQTGAGGDAFVATDDSPAGGFRVNANTETLGLPAGVTTFYARAYDELLTTGKTRMVSVELFDPDTTPLPDRPSTIKAFPGRPDQVQVIWNDNSENEFGFRIERARDEFFTRDVRKINVAADTTSFLDSGLSSGTTYYYRIRSFNVSGASKFAGPAIVGTANQAERVVDVNSGLANGRIELSSKGETFPRSDGSAFLGDTLDLAGKARVNFSPTVDFDGEYFLYARWTPPVSETAKGVFDIRDSNGRQQRSVNVDQVTQGDRYGWVYIGKYTFNPFGDGSVTFRALDPSQTVNIDAFRVLPAFDPTTRG